jgi:hypothetical protein
VRCAEPFGTLRFGTVPNWARDSARLRAAAITLWQDLSTNEPIGRVERCVIKTEFSSLHFAIFARVQSDEACDKDSDIHSAAYRFENGSERHCALIGTMSPYPSEVSVTKL